MGNKLQGPKGSQEDEDKEDPHIDNNGGHSELSPETTTNESRLTSSNSSSKKSSSSYSPTPSYSNRLKPRNKKMEELDQEILNTFRKVETNIPLLDAIKQIPKYAKFFKELCTNKRCIRDNEVMNLGRNVSSLIKKHNEISRKCKDPDLGDSINVMPLLVFTSLSLGPLKTTSMVIQLANRSIVNLVGVLEDVLVQVNKLLFPTDFYILDMKDDEGIIPTTIILGRPFMMTTRTMIDVHARSITMEIKDEKVWFNVLEVGKHPIEDHSLFCIDLLSGVEEQLLQVIKEHKKAIGWTLADIPNICPVVYMHGILLEEDARLVRQRQRRLMKLISNSTWVSPIHVVPKKYGITMVKNEKDKLTPIQDRSEAHNLVVDHLNSIEKGKDNILIQDDLSKEVLLAFLPP
ncbi:hypothetical protein V8G54_024110 [Vigna mungo]|uniref:Uncharacterized protein n=1 Tax=Vigna mungo TaxID=3915 RepID=A0AAQ3RSW8_VIGMU